MICISAKQKKHPRSGFDYSQESEKDRIAAQVTDLRITFDMALSNKRKYPVAEFKAFVQSARRYRDHCW
jgi:hypothetical protein